MAKPHARTLVLVLAVVAASLLLCTFLLPLQRIRAAARDSSFFRTPVDAHHPRSPPSNQSQTAPDDTSRGHGCQPYIFYDKPMKTGSTAITRALVQYLQPLNQSIAACTVSNCHIVAARICNGTAPPTHLLQHIWTDSQTVRCLLRKQYYAVTSIREPRSRLISAFRYSRDKKRNFYGIPHNATFDQFLTRFPRCALFHYYDGRGSHCTDVHNRTIEIATRFDEVIQLDAPSLSGDLHKHIAPFIATVNVAKKKDERLDFHIPHHVVENELILYRALQQRRAHLASSPPPGRRLCEHTLV